MLCVKVSCVVVWLNTVSVGYGAEVGLNTGVQELWDPLQGKSFFIDHMHLATFWEDPRPPPTAQPVVTCSVRLKDTALIFSKFDCWSELGIPGDNGHTMYFVAGTCCVAWLLVCL